MRNLLLYKILKTSHGQIANNENKYKWIFVTDEELTGAPRKLRWSSIGEVILKDKYLLLTINLTGSGNDFDDNGIRNQNYFLININSGKVGRIKNYELAVKNWDLIINEFNFLKYSIILFQFFISILYADAEYKIGTVTIKAEGANFLISNQGTFNTVYRYTLGPITSRDHFYIINDPGNFHCSDAIPSSTYNTSLIITDYIDEFHAPNKIIKKI